MKMAMPKPAKPAGKTKNQAPRWHGAIEGVHRGLMYGWAIDSENPEARVVLEICLNDDPIGCLVADVSRTDLAGEFNAAAPGADTCHGFVADLRMDAKQNGTVSVRVANSGYTFPDGIIWNEAEKPSISATSNVYSDGALRLHGWAVDSNNEKRDLTIHAFVGSTKVAEAVANLDLPAVRAHSAAGHGFTLDLPLSLADGNTYTVRVVDEFGHPINGSPLTICAYANGARALLPDNANRLAADVIETYERHVPRSLGFQHYAAWRANFEHAVGRTNFHDARVGIIVVPTDAQADNEAATATTLASLQKLQGAVAEVFVPSAQTPTFVEQLKAATEQCEFVACVRAGDTLREHALACALDGFNGAGADIVYTDSEYNGQPWFKPAWNPDYAYATDYPLELMLVRTSLITSLASGTTRKRGAAPNGTNASTAAQLAWMSLMAAASRTAESIVHVPRALYQFNSPLSKSELAERASACARSVAGAEAAVTVSDQVQAEGAFHAWRRVARPLKKAERAIAVSLIIPTRDYADMLARCIDSIRKHTAWPKLEIIVIDNGSVEAKTKSYFRSLAKQGVRVLSMPGAFNFADLNNRAVEQASGEIVGLVNNDIEALHDGWLDEIVGQLLRPNVGAVGAKLLWPNGMVQHGGVLMGVGNAAGHYGNLLADQDFGDHGRNQAVQQVTGVTAACLFMRRDDYIALGGMDATAFPVAFNDVDLCLRIRASGKSIVWTPHAKLLHAESASRGHEDSPQKRARAQRELDGLRKRWGHVLLRDPAYHPSLNLDPHSNAFGGLAMPPRDRSPRISSLVAQVAGSAAAPIRAAAVASAPAKTSRAKKVIAA